MRNIITVKTVFILLTSFTILTVFSCTHVSTEGFIDVRKLKNSQESTVVEGQGYFPVILASPVIISLV